MNAIQNTYNEQLLGLARISDGRYAVVSIEPQADDYTVIAVGARSHLEVFHDIDAELDLIIDAETELSADYSADPIPFLI